MGHFYIISGDDDFARKQRVRELATQLCGGNPDPESDECAEIIPGDQPEIKPEEMSARFLEALRTPPFLCDRKLVWMRHHPDLDIFASDRPDAATEELCKFLMEPLAEEIDVLIDGPGLDRRKTRFKDFKKNGAEIEIFNTVRASDKNFAESRRTILADFAKRTGKRIAHDALLYLTEVLGGDSGMLANELEKLHCYTADAKEITLDDCRLVVSKTSEALSWEFTSAVVSGERAKALLTLNTLMSQKESGMEIRLLAGLSQEYQRMIQTRLAMKELKISRPAPNMIDNLSPDIKAQFPANPLLKMHPYRAFKVCESALKSDAASLAANITAIRDASRSLVSGGGDSRMLLEQLILKLCRR